MNSKSASLDAISIWTTLLPPDDDASPDDTSWLLKFWPLLFALFTPPPVVGVGDGEGGGGGVHVHQGAGVGSGGVDEPPKAAFRASKSQPGSVPFVPVPLNGELADSR